MKIGIASAETRGWPKMDWVGKAAENLGHEVVRARTAKELPELLSYCDLAIFGHKSLAGRWPNVKKAIENRTCPIAYWWFDLISLRPGVPIVEQAYFKQWETQLKACDLVLVKERGMIDEYREVGVNAYYMDQGCPSDMPEIGDKPKFWDMLVWGQSGKDYRHRTDDVGTVIKEDYGIAWVGDTFSGAEGFPKMMPHQLYEKAERANCVLSCGRRNDVEGYWSDQFWMALGMGCCVARRSVPGLPDGPFLKYHNGHELRDVLSFVRNNTDQAIQLGKNARQWVMENHTIEHRIEELLRLVPIATGRDFSVSRSPASSFA